MGADVIVGAQFGDEGKGKIVDTLVHRNNYEIVVRYNGGANAGHTVIFDGKTFKLHLVPSGIFKHGTICILGTGTVIDPVALVKEIADLEAAGVDVSGFRISNRAHLILPWHMILDKARECERDARAAESKSATTAIGTTGRGIGPCYETKAARIGIRMGDLKDDVVTTFLAKLDSMYRHFLHDLHLGEITLKRFNLPKLPEPDAVFRDILIAKNIGRFITDTDELTRAAWRSGKKILLEGAQATHLDIECGTYPFVSSSHATSAGACVGSGLPPTAIENVFAVAKAYTTRVGNGPFLTEQETEIGNLLRDRGHEFGTTTGRPRRCGWFDADLVRRACEINGAQKLIVTKLDVLTGLDEILLSTGCDAMGHPVYERFKGWDKLLTAVRVWNDLPHEAQKYLSRIEELSGARLAGVAIGPSREQIIWLD